MDNPIMASTSRLLECPFCDFADRDSYILQLHVEELHREDDTMSPFISADPSRQDQGHAARDFTARQDSQGKEAADSHFDEADGDTDSGSETMGQEYSSPSRDSDSDFYFCPHKGCGEAVLVSGLEDHLDLHLAESATLGHARGTDFDSGSESGDSTVCLDGSSVGSADEADARVTGSNVPKRSSANRGKHSASPFKVLGDSKRRKKTTSTRDPEANFSPHHKHRRRKRKQDGPSSVAKADLSPEVAKSAAPIGSQKRPDISTRRRRKEHIRLGKSELGPFAYEDQMPGWLYRQLEVGGRVTVTTRINPATGRLIRTEKVENEHPGVVPVISNLLATSARGIARPTAPYNNHAWTVPRSRNSAARIDSPHSLSRRAPNRVRMSHSGNDTSRDRLTTEVWLCHPSVHHVGKTPREGGFCGYRNLQMLLSTVLHDHIEGSSKIRFASGQSSTSNKIPGVLQLQDWIEDAWDQGINEIGRTQTGGIKGTRKFIGTPEVHALCMSMGVPCSVATFHDKAARAGHPASKAYESLLQWTESYFRIGAILSPPTPPSSGLSPPFFSPLPSPSNGHSTSSSSVSEPFHAPSSHSDTSASESRSSSRSRPNPVQGYARQSNTSDMPHRRNSPPTAQPQNENFILHKTRMPPIYLQQPGHSITIIGLEKRGTHSSLLVFDPSFHPSEGIRSLVAGDGSVDIATWFSSSPDTGTNSMATDSGGVRSVSKPRIGPSAKKSSRSGTRGVVGSISPARADRLLKVHRRGARELERYRAFEVLAVQNSPLPPPAPLMADFQLRR